MSSSTGVGEGEDRTFRSAEGVQLSAVFPTVMPSGGEVEAFDLGGGLGPEGPEAERSIVLEERSALPCVVQAVTGRGGVVRMMGLSVVVWPMCCLEAGIDK
jgi:hypothetical protein